MFKQKTKPIEPVIIKPGDTPQEFQQDQSIIIHPEDNAAPVPSEASAPAIPVSALPEEKAAPEPQESSEPITIPIEIKHEPEPAPLSPAPEAPKIKVIQPVSPVEKFKPGAGLVLSSEEVADVSAEPAVMATDVHKPSLISSGMPASLISGIYPQAKIDYDPTEFENLPATNRPQKHAPVKKSRMPSFGVILISQLMLGAAIYDLFWAGYQFAQSNGHILAFKAGILPVEAIYKYHTINFDTVFYGLALPLILILLAIGLLLRIELVRSVVVMLTLLILADVGLYLILSFGKTKFTSTAAKELLIPCVAALFAVIYLTRPGVKAPFIFKDAYKNP
jgi:hypothetical protein